jgi:hypothetical protein
MGQRKAKSKGPRRVPSSDETPAQKPSSMSVSPGRSAASTGRPRGRQLALLAAGLLAGAVLIQRAIVDDGPTAAVDATSPKDARPAAGAAERQQMALAPTSPEGPGAAPDRELDAPRPQPVIAPAPADPESAPGISIAEPDEAPSGVAAAATQSTAAPVPPRPRAPKPRVAPPQVTKPQVAKPQVAKPQVAKPQAQVAKAAGTDGSSAPAPAVAPERKSASDGPRAILTPTGAPPSNAASPALTPTDDDQRDAPAPAAPKPAEKAFQAELANQQMGIAAWKASTCGNAGETRGAGKVRLLVESWGRVVRVTHLNQAFVGTPVGLCVMEAFQQVRVPPFEGGAQTLTGSFSVE